MATLNRTHSLTQSVAFDNGHLITCDVENADLAEDDALGERGEHDRPVVRDDRQLAALDDVQLFADVALATDVVARTEDGQLQLEHELHQQPGLALLEDSDTSQRLQVNLRQ